MAAAVRRQSSGRRLSGWRPEDVENLFDENDDDAEKRRAAEQKQEEAERKAQHARSPYRETPRHQARTALLTDMYSDCIQLCAENVRCSYLVLWLACRDSQKVNEKNSWTLDLIDHMGRMIGEPVNSGDESMTNFQLASSTLDAGVKIYAYRVDSVYTETFKLMGGLNRTSKKGDDEAIAEEACANENDGDVRADCATQKKERKRPVSSSIEANPSQLNMKKLELAFEIDPLFHRTSAKFDEGGAKGLLLHNLPVRNGCELVLDSSDPCGAEKLMPATEIPLCGIIDLIPTGFDSMHICEELATLADPVRRADDLTLASEDPCNDADEGLDVGELATGDVDADVDLSDDLGGADALVWQADGETDADGGDGGVDNGADYDAGSESALDLAGDAEGEAREAAFQSRLRMLSEAPQGEAEFGAFEELDRTALSEATPDELLQAQAQQLLNAGHRWAGPSHWKFRAAPRPVSELAKKGAGKAAKPLFVVDFGTRRQCQEALLGMAVDPKGAVLARANLVKANGAAITLPKDCLCRCALLQLCRFEFQDRHRFAHAVIIRNFAGERAMSTILRCCLAVSMSSRSSSTSRRVASGACSAAG
eukprot:6212145-Pleurochrysis_carterae.AAC.4